MTGVDEQGRSCVVSEVEVEFPIREDRGVVAVEQLYLTNELPPQLQPAGSAEFLDTCKKKMSKARVQCAIAATELDGDNGIGKCDEAK